MEKKLVPNNVTLAGLRGLLTEAKKNAEKEDAIRIELSLWDFGSSITGESIHETIEVYRSGTKEGTQSFETLKAARAYIEGWKEKGKEKANVYNSSTD